jgi:hypothetical protein
MHTLPTLILLFILTTFYGANAQWYIIKKDYPSMSMNYPNPGKRSILKEEFNTIDCSIPYSSLRSYEEKTTWLLSCNNKRSPLITVDDSSASGSNSIEDEFYSPPRLISHERRTLRSIPPPYFNEQEDLFNIRLLKRLRQSIRENS